MKPFIFLILAFVISAPSYAEDTPSYNYSPDYYGEYYPNNDNKDTGYYNSSVYVSKETDGLDVLVDVPMRIASFIEMFVGGGIFVGTLPVTASTDMLSPHDSVNKAAEYLITRPARYTFERPVGDYDFDSRAKPKSRSQ